jgi:hypothetical protein
VYDTGLILPEEKDIIEWVRTHPEEAQRLMREHGARFERVSSTEARPGR